MDKLEPGDVIYFYKKDKYLYGITKQEAYKEADITTEKVYLEVEDSEYNDSVLYVTSTKGDKYEIPGQTFVDGSLELARKGDRLELETYNGTATYPNGETVKTSGILEANYANTDSERR